jgi:hypothetical protein
MLSEEDRFETSTDTSYWASIFTTIISLLDVSLCELSCLQDLVLVGFATNPHVEGVMSIEEEDILITEILLGEGMDLLYTEFTLGIAAMEQSRINNDYMQMM